MSPDIYLQGQQITSAGENANKSGGNPNFPCGNVNWCSSLLWKIAWSFLKKLKTILIKIFIKN